jgi:hypothetical protein
MLAALSYEGHTVSQLAWCACRCCSETVQMQAQQQLEQLYGQQAKQPGFQYLAVHLRVGGMEHEARLRSTKGSSNGPLSDLAHGILCIKNLGE